MIACQPDQMPGKGVTLDERVCILVQEEREGSLEAKIIVLFEE
jgi:hypothetical protein